ncbi:hypothetical protein ABT095_01050 [Kitasatospora sp. NPDC002227]|uniref:hypothetical protein n=1 Tax=Kitasatospora sp. NPDC002227 TaxID=3154773 RepID=UPI00331C9630
MEQEGPAIELAGLSKRYGRRTGVEGLDLTVRRGEVFGFLDPNGAGETTTIRCVAHAVLHHTQAPVAVVPHD